MGNGVGKVVHSIFFPVVTTQKCYQPILFFILLSRWTPSLSSSLKSPTMHHDTGKHHHRYIFGTKRNTIRVLIFI